jgi:hypothetical protein
LFVPVCNALQHAHKKGISHRDVKPSSVLVTEVDEKPVPKVIDFGSARATDLRLAECDAFTLAGQIMGTPEYMSPEQASRDIDTGTDVYSLGVVLYELLVGALPLDVKALRKIALSEVLRAIRETPVPKPTAKITQMGAAAEALARQRSTDPGQLEREVSGDLDWIVMKAIDKDRHCRYASASEFAADIERHLKSEPVLAGPPGAAYRVRKFIVRHKRPVAAAAVVVLALIAGIVTTARQGTGGRTAEGRGNQRKSGSGRTARPGRTASSGSSEAARLGTGCEGPGSKGGAIRHAGAGPRDCRRKSRTTRTKRSPGGETASRQRGGGERLPARRSAGAGQRQFTGPTRHQARSGPDGSDRAGPGRRAHSRQIRRPA